PFACPATPQPAGLSSVSRSHRRTTVLGRSGPVLWQSRIPVDPVVCASLRNRPCLNNSVQWSCWDRGWRQSQSLFFPPLNHLPGSLPAPDLAAVGNHPGQTRSLFRMPPWLLWCRPASDRQTPGLSVSLIESDLG